MKLSYRLQAEDTSAVEVDIVPLEGDGQRYRITVDEQVFELSARQLQRAAFLREAGDIVLQYEGREYRLYDASRQPRRAAPPAAGDLRAPMAGKIIQVLIASGDAVKAGDTLIILEAMKMEQQITAPHDGVVDRVLCREGDQVSAGTELVALIAGDLT